jgi:hypothetical protein
MVENHELLFELWSRIKSHIPPKERLEVADIFMIVFDEFSMVDESILDEDLDKELRAAARSLFAEPEEELEEEQDDSGW